MLSSKRGWEGAVCGENQGKQMEMTNEIYAINI
jgi:hypothetical protein